MKKEDCQLDISCLRPFFSFVEGINKDILRVLMDGKGFISHYDYFMGNATLNYKMFLKSHTLYSIACYEKS
jgi:hypothetical protein